jgi:PAS domain S-box-containing protein
MPDSPRHQAGPVGASSHSNVQGSVSGSRPSATSGLFGGRGTAFVVLALSLAITISWSIRFQALPGSGAVGGTGAMFLAAGAIIISLLLFGLVWILTTARLRAEALALEMTRGLQESEARFKSLAHVSADWYWEQDENYRFTERSGGGRGWSKSAIANILGKTRWELPDVDLNDQDWAAHRAVLDARQPFRDFAFRRSHAGVMHHLSVSGEPFFDAQGIFKGYRGIGSDITERLERDNALLESEARFRNAFDSAAIGMAIVLLRPPSSRWERVWI